MSTWQKGHLDWFSAVAIITWNQSKPVLECTGLQANSPVHVFLSVCFFHCSTGMDCWHCVHCLTKCFFSQSVFKWSLSVDTSKICAYVCYDPSCLSVMTTITYYLTHGTVGQHRALVVVMGNEGIFVEIIVDFVAKDTFVAMKLAWAYPSHTVTCRCAYVFSSSSMIAACCCCCCACLLLVYVCCVGKILYHANYKTLTFLEDVARLSSLLLAPKENK